MAAGQPRTDIALRARNWIWYSLVQSESLLSDDDLDRVFVLLADEDPKRPRTFARIRRMGSAPTDIRGYRKKSSIYAAVHSQENRRNGNFEHARRAFESPLWEILTERDLSQERIQEIIWTITRARGLTRVDRHELDDLNAIIRDTDLLKSIGLSIADKDCLTDVYLPQDLDAVAVLAALYREALATHNLKRAAFLQNSISSVCMNFLAAWRPPDFLINLILRLIDDRICGNIWIDEHVWATATGIELVNMSKGGTESRRKREIHAFVKWYLGDRKELTKPIHLSLPKAPAPALEWVREHRETLTAYEYAVRQDRGKIGAFQDSPFEEDREVATQLQQKADGLSAALKNHLQKKFGHYQPPKIDVHRVVPPLNRPPIKIPEPVTEPETVQEMLDRMDTEDRQMEAVARNAHREARQRLVPKDAK